MPLAKLKQLGIGSHVETSGFKRCRQFSFELISLLETTNPRTNYTSLFISEKMKVLYTSWKARQPLIEPTHCCSQQNLVIRPQEIESARKILNQRVELDDFEKKRSQFLKQASTYFKEEKINQEEVMVKVNIENSDMAALKCLFTLDEINNVSEVPIISSEPSSPLIRAPKEKGVTSMRKAVVKVEKVESCFKERLERYLKNGQITSPTNAVVQLRTDQRIEVKVNHRNTIFVLNLKSRTSESNLPKGATGLLNFESVDVPNLPIANDIDLSIDFKVLSGRKLSFGINNHENQIAEKYSGSTQSTVCGSESILAGSPASQVTCKLEGTLTISEQSTGWSCLEGSRQYCMELIVFAKDQQSRSFIREMPEIRHILKNLFLQTYTLISKD